MLWVAENKLPCRTLTLVSSRNYLLYLEYLSTQGLFPVFYCRSSCIWIISLFYFQLNYIIFWENHYNCNPNQPVISLESYENWIASFLCLLLNCITPTRDKYFESNSQRCMLSYFLSISSLYISKMLFLSLSFI